MGDRTGTGTKRLRDVGLAGARGVLMAATCCDPNGKISDCQELWELGREPEPEPTADTEVPAKGRVHVVGSTVGRS
jgi:hypothetical protein